MNEKTRSAVNGEFEKFATETILSSKAGKYAANPFLAPFVSAAAAKAARKERSSVTNLGNALVVIAGIIAKEHYSKVVVNGSISGDIRSAEKELIERIVSGISEPKKKRKGEFAQLPNLTLEERMIEAAVGKGAENQSITCDLFIGDFPSGELYVELKAPLPNKDQSLEAKKKMWFFRRFRDHRKPQAFFGLTYHPFGEGNPYTWSIPKAVMDFPKEVLIGEAFWDKIGGAGTLTQLISCAQEVALKHMGEKPGKQLSLTPPEGSYPSDER